MIAEIISIGDELLIGQVTNTNASWIAQQLHDIGISVRHIRAIADDSREIRSAIDEAFARAEVVLLTGGLGPTKDDITKHTLCEYFGSTLIFHKPSFELIKKLFSSRGLEVTELNRKQAEIPDNCTPLLNYHGTAPGMWFEKKGKILVSLPGVPYEMEAMMQQDVIPRLSKKGNDQFVAHKTVLTQGIGESFLTVMIKEWEDNLPSHVKLAYLPQPGIVRLRLTAFAETREKAVEEIDRQVETLREMIPDLIFGFGNDTLEEVTGRLLKEKKMTVCTAESCTGGYLAHLITSVPGASEYFLGSVVAYAYQAKIDLLGVSAGTLKQYGAVSEATVKEMAEGARNRFGADYALAVSGVAGPGGGTPEKPVGTVWIALAAPGKTEAQKFQLGEHRGRNIRRAALSALNMLRVAVLDSR
jgi:nicotinamide-nucleotide amidase